MAGVYIHIPYCRQACHYCNFHFSTSLQSKALLVDSIIKEIRHRYHQLKDVKLSSIYLGGGTPSLLDDAELRQVLACLTQYFNSANDIDITLEANPEDISYDKLQTWHELGINRLSVGIQSFIDKDLSYMNRAHNTRQSHSALEMVNKSDIESLSLDLMFGLVNSNMEEWHNNLLTALEYRPEHLSIYNLTVEEQTVFAHWKLKNQLNELSTDLQQEQFDHAATLLTSKGYDHYEISNYSLPNHNAIHNTNYWKRVPYLGIGPSAHTYNGVKRTWNIANNAAYIKMWGTDSYQSTEEILTPIDQYNELIMLGLRTKWGIVVQDIEALAPPIQNHFHEVSRRYISDGTLIQEIDRVYLNRASWYLSDHISAELFFTT